MNVLHYGFKLPLLDSGPGQPGREPEGVGAVFHGWIRTRAITDDVLIDVADYGHVPGGPSVLLIAHEGHYALDRSRNRLGLAYQRKRGLPDASPAATAERSLRRLVQAARLFEQADVGRVDTTRLEIRVLDRLRVSNDEAGWRRVEPAVVEALTAVWGQAPIRIARQDNDPRAPLLVHADLRARPVTELSSN